MRKLHLIIITLLVCAHSHAQCYNAAGITEVFDADIRLLGCNFASYFTLHDYLESCGETRLSPAPRGYEPFYISTYARHGSRWLGEDWEYDNPIKFLSQAEAKGCLNDEGKALLRRLRALRKLCPNDKFGVLTIIGAAQHRDIARRMCRNFPTIFDPLGVIEARSSVVKRCVRSMEAEAEIIDSVVGHHIPQTYGQKGMQDRLAGHYNDKNMEAHRSPGYKLHATERDEMTPYKRLCNALLTSTSWTTVKEMQSFSRLLFDLAQNMQSHEFEHEYDLWAYFTPDEIATHYAIKNRHWYRMFGPSPTTGGLMPQRSKWQLEDIIEGADSIVDRRNWHGANLRFGHDTVLMPLICLMELGTSGQQIDETQIANLNTFWRNHEMFPMAGNLQLIFYRPKSGEGDILVKALLCEREVTLPVTPVKGRYYKWSDLRNHWATTINLHQKK